MNKQKGFATLLASVVMVSLVTVTVVIGQKGSVLEQRAANNAYRTEQAFEKAENGIRAGINHLISSVPAAGKLVPPDSTSDYEVSFGTVYYENKATKILTPITYSDYLNRVEDSSHVLKFITVKSTGIEGNSRRTINQLVSYIPGISTPIQDALTALGNIFVGGNASVESVMSGGTVTENKDSNVGSITASDFFQKIVVNGVEQYLMKADGTKIKLTEDEYFLKYFGYLCPDSQGRYDDLRAIAGTTSVALAQEADSCKAEAKLNVAALPEGYICDSNCNNADLAASYASGKRVMWLTAGGMKINANVVLGCADNPLPAPSADCVKKDPVLIFVMDNGTVQINGTSKVYGVVYVDVPTVSETITNITGSVPCTCTASKTRTGNNKWSSISYDIAAEQESACTVSICLAASTKCSPIESGVAIGQVASCTYLTSAPVGDVAAGLQTQVTIEVLGTWNNSGGGNALIEGAAITSGNFSTTGGIELVKNSGVVEKFQGKMDANARGWSDLPVN